MSSSFLEICAEGFDVAISAYDLETTAKVFMTLEVVCNIGLDVDICGQCFNKSLVHLSCRTFKIWLLRHQSPNPPLKDDIFHHM